MTAASDYEKNEIAQSTGNVLGECVSSNTHSLGRLVYDVMTAHVLSGAHAKHVNLIDHAVIFDDQQLFKTHVVKHFLAYAKYRGCDCGAAQKASPNSFDHMMIPREFLSSCVCTHEYSNMTFVVSPDFFGTKITEGSFLSVDDWNSVSTGSSDMEDSENGSLENIGLHRAYGIHYLRWPSPAQASEDTITGLQQKPPLATWLREAEYFRRITLDNRMMDLLDRLLKISISADTDAFLRILSESGRLFAELLVQHFTRLYLADSRQNSLLLEHAHTRAARYLVSLWNPDREHDFVYRATLREAIESDNAHAFRLLSPSLLYIHQRQYRACRFLLADLVERRCWRILRLIVDENLLGKQLRKLRIGQPVAHTRTGFAIYDVVKPKGPRDDREPPTTATAYGALQIMQDVSDSLNYAVLLNHAYEEEPSEPVLLYMLRFLPLPEGLTETDGTGSGGLLTRYYPELRPSGIQYVLKALQPNSVNWKDCAKRTLQGSLRWGKAGREKLLLLCSNDIALSMNTFESIVAQREYWKLTDDDLRIVSARVSL